MSKVTRRVLGITGGIATGKSTVLKILKDAGIPVISSDELAHDCIRQGTPAYRRVVKHFGPEILSKNQDIDRAALGRIVFSNPRERKALERIVHPCVIQGLKRFVKQHKGLIALDIPLLFEARLQSLVDAIVVVACSRSTQLRRLMQRNRLSRKDALSRLSVQWSLAKKKALADVVIANDGSLLELRKRVREQLLKKIA